MQIRPTTPVFAATLLSVFLLLLATSANAFTMYDTGVLGGNPESSLLGVTITGADAGDSFDIEWNVANVVGSEDLSATGNFEILSFSTTQIVMEIAISNTTVLSSSLTNADLLSLGFGVSLDAVATFVSLGDTFDGVTDGSGQNQTYPGNFKGIDVCVFGQGCNGGGVAEGLHAGESDVFRLSLAGDFSNLTAHLLYFGAKFQTNVGSFEPGGSALSPSPPPHSYSGSASHSRRRGYDGMTAFPDRNP